MCFPFFHEYELITCKQYQGIDRWKGGIEQPGSFYTDLVYKCRMCEKIKIKRFAGKWELSDFQKNN